MLITLFLFSFFFFDLEKKINIMMLEKTFYDFLYFKTKSHQIINAKEKCQVLN